MFTRDLAGRTELGIHNLEAHATVPCLAAAQSKQRCTHCYINRHTTLSAAEKRT